MKTVYILFIMLMVSCEKKNITDHNITNPLDSTNSDLKLKPVWKISMSEDNTPSQGRQPLIYKDKLIWNSAPSSQGFTVYSSNADSGNIIWSWNNFLSYPLINWTSHQFIYESYYVMNNNAETNVIDIRNGNSIWQYVVPDNNGYPKVSEINGYIYHKHTSTNWPPQKMFLVRSPVVNQAWDTIFSLDRDTLGDYTVGLTNPTLWISSESDSILLFLNRSYNFTQSDGKVDLLAYNLSQRKFEFIMEDIEPNGNSNAVAPLVEGDRAYILGNRHVHCIDLVNQTELWRQGFPGFGHHLMLSNLIIDGNKLIVKPDNDAIHALDKMTGATIWSSFEAGHSPTHMLFHNGVVYYTSDGDGKLFAVRTRDGKVIWAEDSPHDGDRNYPGAGFDDGGVAIHEDLGYIYAHDKYFMMAFELPEVN